MHSFCDLPDFVSWAPDGAVSNLYHVVSGHLSGKSHDAVHSLHSFSEVLEVDVCEPLWLCDHIAMVFLQCAHLPALQVGWLH